MELFFLYVLQALFRFLIVSVNTAGVNYQIKFLVTYGDFNFKFKQHGKFTLYCYCRVVASMQILVQLILCGLKEMETSQTPSLEIHQKLEPEISQNPMENHVNPEKETDETPVSEVNQEPVETCQDAVVEIDIIPEKQAVPEAGLVVNEEPTETCQETAAESDVNPEKRTSDPGVIYRCRKCRRMLATQEFVVTHEVGAGGKSFRAGKQSNVHEDGEKPECPCIFVEPMKWMQTGQFSTHDVLPLVF